MTLHPFIYLSNHMYMVFPLNNDFIIVNGHFGLKHRRNDGKSLSQETSDVLDIGRKPSQVILAVI